MQLDLVPRGSLDIVCIVNGPIQTNTYFVCSRGEALVIDPAWEGERLLEEFRAQGHTEHVKAVVCTHGHADHLGGVAGLRVALGQDVAYLLPREDAELVGPSIAWQRERWGIDTPHPGEPIRLVGEGDVIEVGDVTLQLLATPGHTPGGVVAFCPAQSGPVAFVGDTLFPGGHGRTDLQGGSEAQIISSLGKLGSLLPEQTVCYTGHGECTTIARERAGNLFMMRSLRRLARVQS